MARIVLSEKSLGGVSMQHANYCWDAGAELVECDPGLTLKYVKDMRAVRARGLGRSGMEERIGRLIVTPPEMVVRARAIETERDMESFIIHVDSGMVREFLGEIDGDARAARIGLDLDMANDAVEQVLLLIARELNSAAPGRDVMIHSLVRILMVELVRHFQEHSVASPAVSTEWLEQVRNFVNNFSEGLPQPSEVAEACGISPSHLRRLFKQATGQTLHEYIESIRIVRARDLLARTDMPLKLIAHRLGFSHCSSFTYAFRRATGETPGQYRQRCSPTAQRGDIVEARRNALPSRKIWRAANGMIHKTD